LPLALLGLASSLELPLKVAQQFQLWDRHQSLVEAAIVSYSDRISSGTELDIVRVDGGSLGMLAEIL
jgi:hypothetical protein